MLFVLLSVDGPLPSVLQEVSVPVVNNTICESMYRNAGYVEHIPHIFICAGWRKGGYDSCEGKMHKCSYRTVLSLIFSIIVQVTLVDQWSYSVRTSAFYWPALFPGVSVVQHQINRVFIREYQNSETG